ncbi:dienelactone hydrolase family protein [Elstera cyanobacteriorum]|uniref:Carboxymethylenebutenolidase n=1 Tax=Elstera cyanobacteriorum TaxID=2022747 RepID=A0A255XP34_9PROT|nr:dienelactone hydrolase family protein [Elstera cyanobacteriorum]MCK6442027.1 dienelactone hydrolase family protein [Elstera cyanobacteriorum]OYQ18662.1 carboxymethylenebutenolidase [Elstera cyanobacteriorum]GFZ78584.1 carboxymethylenebutenolidase [Elstera cyanobacteriorum]
MDDVKLVTPKTDVSRRGFVVMSSLAAGFALAVQPVQAQTQITTDTNGLEAGEVSIPTGTGPIPAYRAQPQGGKNLPLVLVVQEIFGVHEHIKDVCRRLAKLGYCAIAVELFARQGNVANAAMEQIRPIVAAVPDAQVMSDLDAAVAFAKASGAVDTSKLAITGFCWGGRITWLYAAHNPGVKAGIAWYGRVVGDKTALQPANPIDVADKIKAPVLGLYGGADQGIPVASLDQLKAALGPSTKSEFVVYPDAPHAFHADYRPSYREAAAKDGWGRLLAWLKANGVA